MTDTERWLPVVWYEDGYRVSDLGRVYSLLTDKILKPAAAKSGGYQVVNLSYTALVNGRLVRRQHVRKIDHLVLETFVGPRPEGDIHSRHLNDNPEDNRLVNLKWGTRSENYLDAVRNGLHKNASKTHCKNGHEFTEQNTKPNGPGGRACRECSNRRNRELFARTYQPKRKPNHCNNGHEFTEQNTIRHLDGRRQCRFCYNANQRARRARKQKVSQW